MTAPGVEYECSGSRMDDEAKQQSDDSLSAVRNHSVTSTTHGGPLDFIRTESSVCGAGGESEASYKLLSSINLAEQQINQWRARADVIPSLPGGGTRWPMYIQEFTLLIDALERIMQDSSHGSAALLSMKQCQIVAEKLLGWPPELSGRLCPSFYAHWRRRRLLSPAKCLIREFISPYHPSHELAAFSAFKPRQRERWSVNMRRQRRPNRESQKKIFRLARDFVDVVSLMSLIVHIDAGNRANRRLRNLQFSERRRDVLDPNYVSPFERRKLTIAHSASSGDRANTNSNNSAGINTRVAAGASSAINRLASNGCSSILSRKQRPILCLFDHTIRTASLADSSSCRESGGSPSSLSTEKLDQRAVLDNDYGNLPTDDVDEENVAMDTSRSLLRHLLPS
eukprot:GHVH01001587.1.p1 GENE.GHVH01001587.1~~GHVH01001587.1.p1  ORF type:complete len:397 (+),score=48.26 GHVH01001587.1:1046-2236(+)